MLKFHCAFSKCIVDPVLAMVCANNFSLGWNFQRIRGLTPQTCCANFFLAHFIELRTSGENYENFSNRRPFVPSLIFKVQQNGGENIARQSSKRMLDSLVTKIFQYFYVTSYSYSIFEKESSFTFLRFVLDVKAS